jgi:hypothetical protein
MPPKSLITSFLGLPNRTSSDQIEKTRLLFELGLPSISDEDNDGSTRSDILATNQTGNLASTTRAIASDEAPVSRTVKVEPDVPETTKQAGTSLQIKQLWEGTVTEVQGKTFVAVLNDKSQPNSPEEYVEFESVELRQDDWPLVAPGAVFYWMIGTERTRSGQVRNISNIEFSRLPVWTRSFLKAASEKGSRVEQWFHANGNHPS